MKRLLLMVGFVSICPVVTAQSFEVSGLQESYKGSIGNIIHAPLHFKNTTEKPIVLIIRRTETQIGTSQKSLFCYDNNCFEARSEDYVLRIEPGQTIKNFSIGLEAGLTEGFSNMNYVIFNKSNPTDSRPIDFNFIVEEKSERNNIYTSRFITLYDVYPNPVTTSASIDYQLHSDRVKSKIIVHNILGNLQSEYEMPFNERSIKILADNLSAGIYFYTLYIDNEGVMTRKLIVKK
jgi:hypothetical protein